MGALKLKDPGDLDPLNPGLLTPRAPHEGAPTRRTLWPLRLVSCATCTTTRQGLNPAAPAAAAPPAGASGCAVSSTAGTQPSCSCEARASHSPSSRAAGVIWAVTLAAAAATVDGVTVEQHWTQWLSKQQGRFTTHLL